MIVALAEADHAAYMRNNAERQQQQSGGKPSGIGRMVKSLRR